MSRILGVEFGTATTGQAVVFIEYRAAYRVGLHLGAEGWAYATPYADKRGIRADACTINGQDVAEWFATTSQEIDTDARFMARCAAIMLQAQATETAK